MTASGRSARVGRGAMVTVGIGAGGVDARRRPRVGGGAVSTCGWHGWIGVGRAPAGAPSRARPAAIRLAAEPAARGAGRGASGGAGAGAGWARASGPADPRPRRSGPRRGPLRRWRSGRRIPGRSAATCPSPVTTATRTSLELHWMARPGSGVFAPSSARRAQGEAPARGDRGRRIRDVHGRHPRRQHRDHDARAGVVERGGDPHGARRPAGDRALRRHGGDRRIGRLPGHAAGHRPATLVVRAWRRAGSPRPRRAARSSARSRCRPPAGDATSTRSSALTPLQVAVTIAVPAATARSRARRRGRSGARRARRWSTRPRGREPRPVLAADHRHEGEAVARLEPGGRPA